MSGVMAFDTWIKNIFKLDSSIKIIGQFHDEVIIKLKKGKEDEIHSILKEAIKLTNNQLKLNTTLDVDIQFGKTYADIH